MSCYKCLVVAVSSEVCVYTLYVYELGCTCRQIHSCFLPPQVLLFCCVPMVTGWSTSGVRGGLELQPKQASGLVSQLLGWAPPGPGDERNYF